MIPKQAGDGASGTAGRSTLLFRIVVDDSARNYSLDGPESNAMRMHLEVMQASRDHTRKLREMDLRAASHGEALALMREHFPDYAHRGAWKLRPDA